MKRVRILKPVLVSNQQRARENRTFFDQMGSLVINIIASPGAGKTSFITNLVKRMKNTHRILVVEGDIKGKIDSQIISRLGIDVIQINTATECHLDAFMTAQILPEIRKRYDLILVENVGNLVCPAEFEIGEDYKLAILSTPEGDDKPLKYPLLFHLSRVVVFNKCDLLPYVDFSIDRAKKSIRKENPKALIFKVSAKTGEGFGEVIAHIEKEINARKKKNQH
ncbi:MAG: hydrogenase nickel incorporation protein HypB [candidate division WOR-3 bacterium]|nr:MAG: hydrogenase nickel incorporation protein HypB [candidate division WOR-3 bacterium]